MASPDSLVRCASLTGEDELRQQLAQNRPQLPGLPSGGFAAFLAVLPHGGFVTDTLLGLQRFVVQPHRLAGESIVVAACGLLFDLAAIFEQLLGIARVVLAGVPRVAPVVPGQRVQPEGPRLLPPPRRATDRRSLRGP